MWWKNKDEFLPCRVRSPDRAGMVRFFFRQHRTIPALRLKHRSGSCGTASALPKCSIMSGCGTRIVLRGKLLALCDRCLLRFAVPPLAALTFAASSIIYALCFASAAPRSPYRHLELCGIAFIKHFTVRHFGSILRRGARRRIALSSNKISARCPFQFIWALGWQHLAHISSLPALRVPHLPFPSSFLRGGF